MPVTNPSSQDWDRCCASDLGEKPNLNCVFTVHTWEAGLYSRSSPEDRQMQRNTTVGKDLIPRTDQDTSRAQTVPDTQHTFFKELQQSSSWVNKNIRQHRSLRMEECTPKLPSVTQTQELSDHPWPTVERGDDHLPYSLPHTSQELGIFL